MPHNNRWSSLTLVTILVIAVLVGCQSGPTPLAEPTPTPQSGGQVTVKFRHASAEDEDCVTPNVCLWRDTGGPIIVNGGGQIEWACGKCGPQISAWYPEMGKPAFRDACFSGRHENVPGTDVCLHLIDEAQYWDVHWLEWGSGSEGATFAYIRSGPIDLLRK